MKLILAITILLCFRGISAPDNNTIHFENTMHNFGTHNEEDGILYHDFAFTNKGQVPIVVTSVSTGGGVYVTGWSRNPVKPGETGSISLEYDPENKPGKFNRSITIHSTGHPSVVVVRLLGEIIRAEKTAKDLFPAEIGDIRLSSSHLFLGRINHLSAKTDSLQIINLSREKLAVSFSHVPDHIRLKAVPSELNPGDKGLIIARYDASPLNDWGILTHYFRLLVNGSAPERNMVYVSADIQEDFSGMSYEERASAPVISFEDRVFDFISVNHGENVEHNFVFRNTGESELIIRLVKSGCGCTAVETASSIILPGESGSIKTIFNSFGFRGRQNKNITVISNDPVNPNIVLRITGEILSE